MADLLDRLTTNLQSPRVLLTVAAVGALAAGAGWFVRRRGARRRTVALVATVPVVLAGAVLVAPYFRARELVETLPAGTTVRTRPLLGLGGHAARGRVVLHRRADGGHVVRFEDVDIEGTPTPRVYVVPGAGRKRPGGAALGALKAERGTFQYGVAAPVGAVTVLVWCERFAVPIAGATLPA
jgi:hypothetical protein